MATNLPPGQHPGFGEVSGSREQDAFSGVSKPGLDPTSEPGQNETAGFGGIALPSGTGAPGSPGAPIASGDAVNEPGQTTEGFSGEGPDVVADTGAPGSAGTVNGGAGPDAVSYTRPGSYMSGTYTTDTVNENISGTDDWTQAIDGSYGAAQNLPGIQGNMPLGTGAGSGRVLRGGRSEG